MVQSKLLLKYKGIDHFFSKKINSSMDLLNPRRHKFSVSMEQVHSDKIKIIDHSGLRHVYGCDAVITRSRNILLTVRTADCLPVLIFDPILRIAAAVHAGWKGLYKGIVSKCIEKMVTLGSDPRNLLVATGPHIRVCCYHVPFARVKVFGGKDTKGVIKRNSFWYLDLETILKIELMQMDIRKNNTDIIPICTCCHRNYPSFRRDGRNSLRQVSGIELK